MQCVITAPFARVQADATIEPSEKSALQPFADRLTSAIRQKATPAIVGLDPRLPMLPDALQPSAKDSGPAAAAAACETFCREVIDVVAPLVPAIKPQVAFFEQFGAPGMQALARVIKAARQHALIVIADAKRGDIGSTAEGYADAWLGPGGTSPWGADALTVNPYLGDDALAPFVQIAGRRQAGLFVLVKTSNPGGARLQDAVAQGKPIYRHVGDYVETLAQQSQSASGYGAVGAVVGATHPDELAALRDGMSHCWFLVPGYGSQGAGARDVRDAFDRDGLGAIINSSRGIIYAHDREPYRSRYGASRWQQAVEAATRDMIEALRAETPAAHLAASRH